MGKVDSFAAMVHDVDRPRCNTRYESLTPLGELRLDEKCKRFHANVRCLGSKIEVLGQMEAKKGVGALVHVVFARRDRGNCHQRIDSTTAILAECRDVPSIASYNAGPPEGMESIVKLRSCPEAVGSSGTHPMAHNARSTLTGIVVSVKDEVDRMSRLRIFL